MSTAAGCRARVAGTAVPGGVRCFAAIGRGRAAGPGSCAGWLAGRRVADRAGKVEPMRTGLSVDEAQRAILEAAPVMGPETVPVREALGPLLSQCPKQCLRGQNIACVASLVEAAEDRLEDVDRLFSMGLFTM